MSEDIPDLKELIILIRGAGEMATGVAYRLFQSGFRVCLTEIAKPLAVRREVSFSEAVRLGGITIEGVTAKRVENIQGILDGWHGGWVPVLIDPEASIRKTLNPEVLVDAILAKKNLGTRIQDASLVIGLGPGFQAGKDVHYVVETNRGHHLGRVIPEGEAEPDTGIPGMIAGYTEERVLRAPGAGIFSGKKKIGGSVKKGERIAEVSGFAINARISGVLRGVLPDGIEVLAGMKVGDIDPRGIREHCFTISDKARGIGGGVLEAILRHFNR